ncbi:MAG: S46 family peptidase, partial [Gemmatimonadetes bacterium]|nr:S46 family peptidase [Gemmatimonadota bacterium]
PLVRPIMQASESPEQAARRLVRESRALDPAFRTEIITGGVAALQASTDPLIRFALIGEDEYQRLNSEWQGLTAAEDVQNARLAEAMFAVYGTDQPPDATFTLRISDGVVQGYSSNGTAVAPFTTFSGMYERSAQHGNQMPFTLPTSFEKNKSAVNMNTQLNLVGTNDITGGNSGSPLIDKEARVVGIAFDGNMEQLPNEFVYRNVAGRSISVHSAGILEALRNIYRATALVNELLATSGTGTGR